MPITELPPFTPRLEDYKAEEFLQHTLELLAFPIQLDQDALDLAPFEIKDPPRPPEPPIPLLPHLWYPRAAQSVTQRINRLLTPPKTDGVLIGEAMRQAIERILRPLLSGQGPVMVQGEPGIGKTALLKHIANHERTKQRYRRIWWVDDPARVGQMVAVALDLGHVLAEIDPVQQLNMLCGALGDSTLLIVDNAMPDDPLLPAIQNLSPSVLISVRTGPEIVPEGEELPEDPANVITLRRMTDVDAITLLAKFTNLWGEKGIPREARPIVDELARLLGNHPFLLVIASRLHTEDEVPLETLIDLLRSGEIDVLSLSLKALPAEYVRLLESFAVFSPLGTTIEALANVLNVPDEIMLRRGLSFLSRRHLLLKDERFDRYSLPVLLYDQYSASQPHSPGKNPGERARQWIVRFAEQNSYDEGLLFENEHDLRYGYTLAEQHGFGDLKVKLNRALSIYLHTYFPAKLPKDAPPPRLTGERAQAVQLARQGLEQVEQGDFENGKLLLTTALQQIEMHGSDHEQAEALVMLARAHDLRGEFPKAIQNLEKAAKLVFDLNAEESVSSTRLGLAMAYRREGRLRDALGVLDESPETYAERARIYRAMGNLKAMSEALGAAVTLSPYEKAESYLQARRYANALEAIANDNTPQSHHLRALIYHIQEAYEEALKGYKQALHSYPVRDAERANSYRAIASIHVVQDDCAAAEKVLMQTLDELGDQPVPEQRGRTLSLLAAVHLRNRSNRAAIETAHRALELLLPLRLHHDIAEAYRTLGRACWNLERYPEAREAFVQETEHAQSSYPREEKRIGIAFFHAAEAYRMTGEPERAVANQRRALTHLDPDQESATNFMVQTALYHALMDAGRHKDALDVNQAAVARLDRNPPPDLQHLGYTLIKQVRICEALNQKQGAFQAYSRWLTTLTGRADSLTDARPALPLLALMLAVRSLLAADRAEEAAEMAVEATQLAEAHFENTDPAWAARRDYGEALLAENHWQQAHIVLLPLLQDYVQNQPQTYSKAYEGVGDALYQLGDARSALNHYFTALDHQANPHWQGLILEKVAQCYLAVGEVERAIENFNEAMKFLDRQKHPGDAARVLTQLAHTLTGVNRYGEAIGVYERALELLRAVPDANPLYTARVHVSLGRSNEIQGQLQEAVRAYRNSLEILDHHQLSVPDEHRAIILNLARVLVKLKDYNAALPYFEQARDAANDWGTPQEVGSITREMADAQRDGGRLQHSLQTYEDALAFLTTEFPQDRAAARRSQGQALYRANQFEAAREAWNEALALAGEDDPLQLALTHRAIGQAYRAQKDYASAEESFRQAIHYHRPHTEDIAATYRELGEVLLEDNRSSEALPPLQSALDTEKTLPQQSNARLVTTLELLGQASERSGNHQNAITHYHAALVYMDKAYQPLRYADTLRTLARLYSEQAIWSHCQKALAEALELELAMQPRSEERIAETFRKIADAYHAEGYLEKAANAYKKMATYANLSSEDASKLRSTLDDIDRHKATLRAALESLQVLERTRAEPKDFAFVYALLVKTHYLLSDFEQSRSSMERLVKILNDNAERFKLEDERPDYRSLANLRLALQYEAKQDRARARDHYRAALKDNADHSMSWLIENGLQSLN